MARYWLMGSLLLVGCDGFVSIDEEPPSRIRSLTQPRWEVQPGDTDASGVVTEVGVRAPTPTPVPDRAPTYKGVTQTVLEVFERTELRDNRLRALEQASRALAEADVTQAYAAIQSGRRTDAIVGIALLSRYYDRGSDETGEAGAGSDGSAGGTRWDRLEDAYRTLFQSVPSLRLSPEHVAEHAVVLAMLGQFNASLAEARTADELFRALPVGDDTRPHLSRLAQAQAWSYEGLAREALKNGVPDAESRSLQQQAIMSWEKFIATAKAITAPDSSLVEEVRKAEEHLQNLKQNMAMLPSDGPGGSP